MLLTERKIENEKERETSENFLSNRFIKKVLAERGSEGQTNEGETERAHFR